jgi:hypothetical protein
MAEFLLGVSVLGTFDPSYFFSPHLPITAVASHQCFILVLTKYFESEKAAFTKILPGIPKQRYRGGRERETSKGRFKI